MKWEEAMVRLINHLEDHVLDMGGSMGMLKEELERQLAEHAPKKPGVVPAPKTVWKKGN